MNIELSYNEEFDNLMSELHKKYPSKLFDVDGIGEQLDLNKFSKNFFTTNNTSDVSVDANANVDDISVIAYSTELPKPYLKLNSYYMLWKELKKNYSLEIANEVIEKQINGTLYINDAHGIGGSLSYCFNYSTYDIMLLGLPMIKKIKSVPPKYLYSFKSQLEQFTIIAANSTLGATGLADMLLVMSYYVKNALNSLSDANFHFKDVDSVWKYVEENIVSFIYTINQPLRGNQSCFTNISIYDDNFLNSLKDDYVFLDGTTLDVELVKKIQDLFLTIMNDEMKRTPITFPITTACFSVDQKNNIQDKSFLKFVAKHNKEFGFINIYCGASSTLSSCCFDGTQNVLTKSSNGVYFGTFQDLYDSSWDEHRKNFTIYHNGSWSKGKLIRLPKNDKKMYKIITANNKGILVTDNHIHLTMFGEKDTLSLTTNDYLAFNCRKLDSFPEKCKNLTYNQGFLIGLYLGDGSKYKRKDSNNYEITFSLNETNKSDLTTLSLALKNWGIEKEFHIYYQHNTMLVKIYSEDLYNIINEYVAGNYAHEKEIIVDLFLQSVNFRKGICDGWYASDGGNNNRIYSISKKLIQQGEALFNSIGYNTIVDMFDRTSEKVIIREQIYNRNYPLYSLRWYDMKNRRSMEDVYKIVNNTEYFKIKSIEEYHGDDEFVYCFEMKNQDEPYFTLPNGIITHNCRLRSDTNNEYFNSFGAGSSKIGSLAVVTINLPRLAIKHKNNEQEFYLELKHLVNLCAKINNVRRKLVQKRIDNGNHPLYAHGFINIKKQYSTVGINGFNECIEILGKDILNDNGTQLGLKIIEAINQENTKCSNILKTPHNCEQIPAETVSVKLAAKDKLLKFQNTYNIYSNQFIPLTTKANILDRIRLQGIFDKHFSGGAIAHINVDTQIEDEKQIEDLIETCAKQGVIYFAINYVLSKCVNGHMSVTNGDTCSICGEKITDKYTRVVGFLVNVKNFNKTRREEDFPNRQFYKGGDI